MTARRERPARARSGIIPTIDHLVYATPDLDTGIARLERLLGVRASPGGRHPNWGTRNALVALDTDVYIEVIGPDPASGVPTAGRPFGIDQLNQPQLVTWAVKCPDLATVAAEADPRDWKLGRVVSGGRRRPDGVVLSWTLTDPFEPRAQGIIPFLIDWGETPHPAACLERSLTLVELRAEHPDAQRVQADLAGMGLEIHVLVGACPALLATIATPKGLVEIQ